jgi:hypothetical protein
MESLKSLPEKEVHVNHTEFRHQGAVDNGLLFEFVVLGVYRPVK